MKKLLGILVFALTLFQIFSLTASEINLDQKIPFDQEIVYKKLDNGLNATKSIMTKIKVKAIVDLWYETQMGCMHKCLRKQHEFSDLMWGLYKEFNGEDDE